MLPTKPSLKKLSISLISSYLLLCSVETQSNPINSLQLNNQVWGSHNLVGGNGNYVNGNGNSNVGSLDTILGSNNEVNGNMNLVFGDGNLIFGDDNSVVTTEALTAI
jgi:hypothetical protein